MSPTLLHLDDSPTEWHWDVQHGDVVASLTKVSKEVDLMVLGHHHVTGFFRHFFFTDDEKLLDRSHCPILIVPDD